MILLPSTHLLGFFFKPEKGIGRGLTCQSLDSCNRSRLSYKIPLSSVLECALHYLLPKNLITAVGIDAFGRRPLAIHNSLEFGGQREADLARTGDPDVCKAERRERAGLAADVTDIPNEAREAVAAVGLP